MTSMYFSGKTRLDSFLLEEDPTYGYIEMSRRTWQNWYPKYPLVTASGVNKWSLPNFETIIWDARKLGEDDFGLLKKRHPSQDNCWPVCIDDRMLDGRARVTTWQRQVIGIQM
jgi:hypothetical protein